MEVTTALLLGTAVGLAAGGGLAAVIGARVGRSGAAATGHRPASAGSTTADGAVVAEVADVLAVLRSGAVVVDAADAVVLATPAAVALGLVRGQDLAFDTLSRLARQVRRDGVVREADLDLPREAGASGGQQTHQIGARVARLGERHVLLLIEDRTQAKRLEAVRRDFVANVSHELKTPVGGIALLAEAVLDAKDDPAAVARFATRISTESTRLTRLVQDIVDLSRLQASQSLSDPVRVSLAQVVREAVDQVQTLASARRMSIILAADEQAEVYGDPDLLGAAVTNLLTNAINYSAEGTRVAVKVQRDGHLVAVTVSDQGQGIPAAEQERIFERFYRVDPARSRATGGTGLGLAIVKHICTNHGGQVRVWSQVGQGSTFTIQLPSADPRPAAGDAQPGPVGNGPSPPDPGTDPARHQSGAPGPPGTPAARARETQPPREVTR